MRGLILGDGPVFLLDRDVTVIGDDAPARHGKAPIAQSVGERVRAALHASSLDGQVGVEAALETRTTGSTAWSQADSGSRRTAA